MKSTIELTDEEREQLLGLLDLAVKAGGLPVAGFVTHFAQLIHTAKKVEDELG
jgi:hypothetical protein